MRKKLLRPFALVLTVLMLLSALPLQAMAADYRSGAQSGPSTSYKNGIYYQNYKRVPITGDNRTDLLAIALSQLGYQEGAKNGAFSGEVSGGSNYVEFSYNLGDLGFGYGGSVYPWCASFVTWCLYQSHCTDQATYKSLGRYHVGDYDYIWKEINCSQWVRQLKGAGYYKYSAYEGGSYTPKSGDLVFFQNSKGVAHIGICLYTANGRIYTVEGNTSDAAGLEANGGGVYFKNYLLTTSYINDYGVLPYKSDASVPDIDYSGKNPTPGLYISNANKYIYTTETGTSHSYIMDRFTMFEVTEVCSNGRLKVITRERNGSTVTGYITNNSDRVIQLSSSQNNALEAAKTNLQKVVDQTGNIRHYNYTEAKLLEIRTAYADAQSLLSSSNATAAQLNAAADKLTGLMAQTGSNTIALNNKGIYINGRNSFIKAGDCFIYSPTWNNGLITVDNANIRYTINVVCSWDASQQVNVVKSISYGKGNSTPSIQLAADEFLIACHNWETGVADSDGPVAYSGTNYKILSELEIGSAVKLSGCTALNAGTDVQPGAFLKFAPPKAVMMTGRNESVAAGQSVLLTPAFENGLLTPSNSNIQNTLNVLVKWDNEKSAWIVAEKFTGIGESDSIQLVDGQVLIAACPGTDAFSDSNYSKLNAAKVGQKVIFSGITPDKYSSDLSTAANISFVDYASGDGSVVIDLSGRYQITDVRAHIFAGDNTVGAAAPEAVTVSVSPDGTNYIKVGTMDLAEFAATGWVSLGEDAIVGRYLKLDVTCDGIWTLINEIEVFGAPHTQSVDDNIALGKTYIAPAYPGSTFTADLTDGVASNMLQYNVNNDAWFGFYNTGDAATGNVGTNDRGIITLDLGGHAEITSVSVNLFAVPTTQAPPRPAMSTSMSPPMASGLSISRRWIRTLPLTAPTGRPTIAALPLSMPVTSSLPWP